MRSKGINENVHDNLTYAKAMNKLLSVCIPSFNMERYLSRNLDSFLESGCLDNLELIVVNDGSTDNTLKIANEYKTRYPDTIVVIDKQNGHYGSCVNAALKIASAKYFRIVDADDWVDTASLKILLQTLNVVNTDVVYTRYSNFYEKDGSTVVNADPADMTWCKSTDLNDLRFDKYVHMHQITYLTQFLRDINYVQTEGVCYTDTEYVFKPLIQAKNIYSIDASLYQYYIGRDDQSMSPNVLMKNFTHLQKVLLSILDYPRPSYTNINYEYLYNYYITTLLGMLVDCLYASRCRNKYWNSNLRSVCKILESKGLDLSRFLAFSIRGCHWFKWWLEDTALSRCKLRILFYLIDLRSN